MLADLDANAIGEMWRRMFFAGSRGCYDTFVLRQNVESLPYDVVKYSQDWVTIESITQTNKHDAENNFEEIWTRARLYYRDIGMVQMYYRWEQDGCLAFTWENGGVMNDDCKKDRGWVFLGRGKTPYMVFS